MCSKVIGATYGVCTELVKGDGPPTLALNTHGQLRSHCPEIEEPAEPPLTQGTLMREGLTMAKF